MRRDMCGKTSKPLPQKEVLFPGDEKKYKGKKNEGARREGSEGTQLHALTRVSI
jgi:hypothetical protein